MQIPRMWGSADVFSLVDPCQYEFVKYSTQERVHVDMARLSGSRPELGSFIDEAGRLLALAVPYDGACWHTVDPATLIETSFRAVNLPPLHDRMAELEYLREDYNKFDELARGARHSGVLSAATAGDLDRSARYREILGPCDVRGELRVSFVADGACWGCCVVFRHAPDDFSAAERDFAHHLATELGRGMRGALVHRTEENTASPGAGLILLDAVRRVESVTAAAHSWLTELGFTGDPAHDPLPHALLAVAARARHRAGDAIARAPTISGGWVVLQASAASGPEPGRVAIILQAATLSSIAPLIAAAYSLTRRERELTELVLQGHVTGDIATRLFISPHTVQEHLKSIFAKAGVHSRRELVGQVFMRHYRPRIEPVGITLATRSTDGDPPAS
jgi:DNA-binding CsgD family transcriptional regulator